MEKSILYVRVSSKEQKEEGFSIPSQKNLLAKYAKKHGFEVVGSFEDVETAKRAGRSQYGKMLQFLRKNKDVEHVLVEKTDRLYRNYEDKIKLEKLRRFIHLVKDGRVLGKDAKPTDKFMHNISVALGQYHVDNLSEEVKKGMLEKAKQGYFPSCVTLGYLNNRNTRMIEVDFERAKIIRKLFEEYATGHYRLKDLVQMGYEQGLRSKKGKKVGLSTLHRMLQNPLYVGDFIWNGKFYRGKHQGIVPRAVFEKVQEVLHSNTRPTGSKRTFAFRGLLKCGYCGCNVTAELIKGRYVYYRCTRGRGKCPEKAVREEKLAITLGEPLKRLRMSKERTAWLIEKFNEDNKDQRKDRKIEIKRIEDKIKLIDKKMDRLYEDSIKGVVPEEFLKRKFGEYREEQESLSRRIEELQKEKLYDLEKVERIFELAQNAYSIYITSDSMEKRRLLDILLSNSILKGGEPHSELKEVFATLADGVEEEEKLTRQKAPICAIEKKWYAARESNPEPSD